jgi:hypothetical protein
VFDSIYTYICVLSFVPILTISDLPWGSSLVIWLGYSSQHLHRSVRVTKLIISSSLSRDLFDVCVSGLTQRESYMTWQFDVIFHLIGIRCYKLMGSLHNWLGIAVQWPMGVAWWPPSFCSCECTRLYSVLFNNAQCSSQQFARCIKRTAVANRQLLSNFLNIWSKNDIVLQ